MTTDDDRPPTLADALEVLLYFQRAIERLTVELQQLTHQLAPVILEIARAHEAANRNGQEEP